MLLPNKDEAIMEEIWLPLSPVFNYRPDHECFESSHKVVFNDYRKLDIQIHRNM